MVRPAEPTPKSSAAAAHSDDGGCCASGPSPPPPPTVCVIGSGPGGMSFLHALATRRSKLRDAGDVDGMAALPIVTCYEKSGSPGGVWRSATWGKEEEKKEEGSKSSAAGAAAPDTSAAGSAPASAVSSVASIEPTLSTSSSESCFGSGSGSSSDCENEQNGDGNVVTTITTGNSSNPSPNPTTKSKEDKTNDNSGGSAGGGEEKEESSTNMYEALWINGNKEPLEFYDYTFDDHFHRPMPVFLPRANVIDYVLSRVTTKEDIFTEYVNFHTAVVSVSYDSDRKKFDVVTENGITGVRSNKEFDKCIWSGGLNARAKVPKSMVNMLRTQKFAGSVIHSTELKDFERTVRGKRVMFIGDSYSAEDLALQSLKLGAEKVYMTSRGGYGTAAYVGAWPMDKVEILRYALPYGVTSDGTGLRCGAVEWNYDTDSYQRKVDGDESEDIVIEDLATVVFCTGYEPNMDCLASDLKEPWDRGKPKWVWSAPDGWTMEPNCIADDVGTVIPSTELTGAEYYVRRGIYRHALISNPNMMFLYEATAYPLLEIDVAAWLCLAYVCGDVELPDADEMDRRNFRQSLDELSVSYLRYYKDENYYAALQDLPADHWWRNLSSGGYQKYVAEYYRYENKILARNMTTSGHPGGFGTYDRLSERGELNVDMTVADCLARYVLTSDSPESSWRTFRDCDPSPFRSLFTGTEAVPLKGRWMELDNGGDVKEESG